MVYPVSCTAGCYVTVITLFVKKVGVVRPIFFWGGEVPDPPSGCALGVKLLKRLRDAGTVDRRPGSEDVVVLALKRQLVLNEEDKPQTHRTVREISPETGIHWCIQNAVSLHFFHICRISAGSVATSLHCQCYIYKCY